MKHRGKLFVWSLSTVLFVAQANASLTKTDASPYRTIAQRNVFSLTHLEPEPPRPPIVQRAKVFLLGIATILGDKRVILKIQPPAESGKPAHEQSFILKEGASIGDIQVVEVDEKTAKVKISNAGEIALLTFEK